MTQPDFSIVIVNRNAADLLIACLHSIRDTREAVGVEVILVDNGSTDESIERATAVHPELIVIALPENIGYVPANNVGEERASGRYLMYLNADTEIRPGRLRILRDFLDSHPRAGAISARIVNPDGSDQGVARRFPTVMNGLFGRRSVLTRWFPRNRWSRRYMVCREHTSREPFDVDILSAAAMVVRTDLARRLDGFDEAFSMYWVDAEMCGRVRRAGYTIHCVPAAEIMHHEGKGGSTATFRQRCRLTIAFNRDAYRAYWKYHAYGPLDPRRLFAAAALTIRVIVLMGAQLLRPRHATSSGGRN